MRTTPRLTWGDRLRWASVGVGILLLPAMGIWVFVSTVPQKDPESGALIRLDDATWLKLKARLEIDNITSRPRFLRGRIEFDHALGFWFNCRDSSPDVTAVLHGDYSSYQLEQAARYAAAVACLSFRGASRTLTLHLWNERTDGDVRLCVVRYGLRLRGEGGVTYAKINQEVELFDSTYSRRS